MSLAAEPTAPDFQSSDLSGDLSVLRREIEHAARLLPTQGPITVFIHHNTLHAFEHLPFDDAVIEAQRFYGAEPYLSEARYRRELEGGRILPHDLHTVLLEGLEDQGDVLIGCLGTRHELQLAMLRYPLSDGSDAEIRWFIHEDDALIRFRSDVSMPAQRRLVESTKHWLRHDVLSPHPRGPAAEKIKTDLGERFELAKIDYWSEQTWEAATLYLLWLLAWHGAHYVPAETHPPRSIVRHRDALLQRTGHDIDRLVNAELTRLCAAYLDQGFASWQLPHRDEGLLVAYQHLIGTSCPVERWMAGLPQELARVAGQGGSPLTSIAESLTDLGIGTAERGEYITQTLLALKGWAGMLWQMETNGEWTVRPARENTLLEYLAVRLILERLALATVARDQLGYRGPLSQLRAECGPPSTPSMSLERRAFQVFQLAQLRCWSPAELDRLSPAEWRKLFTELDSFNEMRRRRLYHLAYERRYRNQTLDALAIFSQRRPERLQDDTTARPPYQVVCCIDDREESFRRHIEEVDPTAETFAMAGYFGVAMYYRGATEAHYRPLCPISIKPRHYVAEVPVFSLDGSGTRQEIARRRMGRLSHHLHLQTRTAAGGFVVGLLGAIASLPLVLRILFPRATAKVSGLFRRAVDPVQTQLRIERTTPNPGPEDESLGYSIEEMADIVEGGLRAMGMTRNIAPLVFIMGHSSVSMNNPHEAAYDCGACGGGRGGPNARAFAAMANEPRVRAMVAQRGVVIPYDVYFVGGSHNTCDGSLTYYDLERLPQSKWGLFAQAKLKLDIARARDAHERCRRFESAPFSLPPEGALRHVENRSQDLSQARPEYCHATNAVGFVGRRSRTRGLFMDRRTLLTSYDPTTDDEQTSVLAGLLSGVVPVCAGINLEYYFSAVDAASYGCGSKLPHNVAALVGVMEGAESDLRPGLSIQMIEIHEPLRILFVVETTPTAMLSIMDRNPAINRLVRNQWIQLSVLDPYSDQIQVFANGKFEPYYVEDLALPTVTDSVTWYRGWRRHLGYAEIDPLATRLRQDSRD